MTVPLPPMMTKPLPSPSTVSQVTTDPPPLPSMMVLTTKAGSIGSVERTVIALSRKLMVSRYAPDATMISLPLTAMTIAAWMVA